MQAGLQPDKAGTLWCYVLHMSDRNNTKCYMLPSIVQLCHIYTTYIAHPIDLCYQRLTSNTLDFGLAQIYPMTDDLTGAEPKIVSTSFADPYVLVVRDDASIMVLEVDDSGDLDEVERGDILLATKWLSGCLYKNSKGTFSVLQKDQSRTADMDVFLFLLGATGGLQVSASSLDPSLPEILPIWSN